MIAWLDRKLDKYRVVVLVFFPGSHDAWSQQYLEQVNRELLRNVRSKLKGNVYGVTAQRRGLNELTAKLGLDFRLICDQSLALSTKYRVYKSHARYHPLGDEVHLQLMLVC